MRGARRPRPAAPSRLVAQTREPRTGSTSAEDRGRGPLPQAPQVLAEPGLERPERAALEALDEAADEAEAVLEGEPRVALAPLGRRSAAGRGRRRCGGRRSRPGAVARRLAGRIACRNASRSAARDRRGAQVALDAVEDRRRARRAGAACAGRAARRRARSAPSTGREAVRERSPAAARPRRPAAARARSSSSSGAWPLLRPPPRWSRQTCSGSAWRRPRGGRLGGPASAPSRRPDELVGDERPAARRAARREQVAERRPSGSTRAAARRPCAWNAASRWRTSGGRRTTSASSRVSGLDSSETARRCRSTAARATQPPRPNRSATTSPGLECASIRAATSAGRRRRREPLERPAA